MKIISLSEISNKDKKALVASACLMYKKFVSLRKFINDKKISNGLLNDSINGMDNGALKNISLFETLLNLLTEEESLIIKNDFISDDVESDWYLKHWSKTTYYKLRNQAIDSFLFLFYV